MRKEYTLEERKTWLKGLPSIPAGAVLLLENPHQELLVVKANYRHRWTPPGGVVDEGESPRHAAIREVKEEVGLDIEPESVKFLAVHYRKDDARDTYQFIFEAQLPRTEDMKIVLRESEIEAFTFVTKQQVKENEKLYSPAVLSWVGDSIAGYSEIELPSH